MVVSLPTLSSAPRSVVQYITDIENLHLVVEHLALARLSLGDQALVKHIEDILADVLELLLNLLTVFADDVNVLVRALGLLFLLDT